MKERGRKGEERGGKGRKGEEREGKGRGEKRMRKNIQVFTAALLSLYPKKVLPMPCEETNQS
jgi:hypothetical protein